MPRRQHQFSLLGHLLLQHQRHIQPPTQIRHHFPINRALTAATILVMRILRAWIRTLIPTQMTLIWRMMRNINQ
eukprot:12901516-Prorocentrum_lima.AAC.1